MSPWEIILNFLVVAIVLALLTFVLSLVLFLLCVAIGTFPIWFPFVLYFYYGFSLLDTIGWSIIATVLWWIFVLGFIEEATSRL
jgi:hypothetical protein